METPNKGQFGGFKRLLDLNRLITEIIEFTGDVTFINGYSF